MDIKTLMRRRVASLAFLSMALAWSAASAQVSDDVITQRAESADDAASGIYGSSEESLATYTSHFNLDNRRFQSPPTTTRKLQCLVECVTVGGSRKWFGSPDARRVELDELDVLDINRFHLRVKKCRFWWKLPHDSDYHHSVWAEAGPGEFIVYAFIEWSGENDYYRPIYFYSEPLNAASDPTAADDLASDGATAQQYDESAIIKEAMASLRSQTKLGVADSSTTPAASGLVGKVIDVSPCGPVTPDPVSGSILLEAATEMSVPASSPQARLFIEYLFCLNRDTGQLVGKFADSLLLNPGSGLCGLPNAQVDLSPGRYRVIARLTVRNNDGSETILDTKRCDFEVN